MPKQAFLAVSFIVWLATTASSGSLHLGDSPQCRLTMLSIVKCFLVSAFDACGGGRLVLPDSLSQIDQGFVCPCSKSKREKYVYLVSKDRQSFFLCCPVALREAKRNSDGSFLFVSDFHFGRARGDIKLKFPIAVSPELEIDEFLGFKFNGKFACKSFGKYRVLGVKDGEIFITIILNPGPLDLRLSKKFKLDDNEYSLTRSEVNQIIEENQVTEPSVIGDLYKHSR
jgi:hypothetical protein